MVLCNQFDPYADCGDSLTVQREGFECPSHVKKFNCSDIIGRDHLKEKRARKFRCRSKRIKALAQPKHLTPKYSEEVVDRCKIPVEIERSYQDDLPTRIKMLAYPKVRKLVSSREEYKDVLDKEWRKRFDKRIKESMMTMYSRLANVHLPQKVPRRKWKKADWERHCQWLKKRACPRVFRPPPRPKRQKVPIESLDVSMLMLSRPRHPRRKYRPYYGFESNVKSSALGYQISERVLKLSVPKVPKVDEDEDEDEDFVPFTVKPSALVYKLTERTRKLAAPKPLPKPSIIQPELDGALKPRPDQQRLQELAKPKDKGDDDEENAEKPLVNPKALKAKATPRLLELAKPRVIPN